VAGSETAFPPAQALLSDVRARLPHEPLEISGDLKIRRQKGVVVGQLNVAIRFDLGATPATMQYEIRDVFGKEAERLTVRRGGARGVVLDYETGDPPTPADLPALYGSIRGSDVSWADLALLFLDWPGGETVALEDLKGQPCYVVEIPAPPGADLAAAGRSYAKVKLWIHESMRLVLRAEGYDRGGQLVRRLEIRGVRKVEPNQWMVKEMEVESFPSAHRTRFCVRDVDTAPGYDGSPGD
jgi:hypothetical protein